ncbi:MAG TPA: hypothetical protein VNI60_05700 [Pyrinomonadaceae bacterium]|nr:hypothetical protein [Pyrinomonadaceae bacterium]
MRGTKLTAWQIPPVWKDLQENDFVVPQNSSVPQNQKKMLKATREVLTAIAGDVRGGLLETVGIESSLSTDDGPCSVVLELPAGTDTKLVARAIDLENVEAWRDAAGKVHVGINPWYSTKDVDQTVLCTIKVIHVLLGIHATDAAQPKTFKQKLLSSVADIMAAQKGVAKRKD